MHKFDKAKKGILITLVVYLILVATHLGEFWPFSIYPMFSKAGSTWTRAMAMEIPDCPTSDTILDWSTSTIDTLPGNQFVMREHGVDQIDFANFVSKTTNWTPTRILALKKMLDLQNSEKSVYIYKVSGSLSNTREVNILATPVLILCPNDHYLNPNFDHAQ